VTGGVEGSVPPVGEHDSGFGVAWEVGVAGDAEEVLVVEGVVVPAEGDEVLHTLLICCHD
jgi:hypothetical protein